MATTRVYILAKELGVKSTAIVKKCQDEGLDIKNHMSVISAGLAATIREWFSESGATTAVETAEKVDLKKVRVKKKKKKKAKKAVKKEEKEEEKEPAVEPELKEEIEEAEQPPQPEEKPKKIKKVKKAKKAKKAKPKPVVPAGPMLEKPKPAKLAGPTVIRVEAPEPARPPIKRKPKPRYDEPITQPLMQKTTAEEVVTEKKGKGKKEETEPMADAMTASMPQSKEDLALLT